MLTFTGTAHNLESIRDRNDNSVGSIKRLPSGWIQVEIMGEPCPSLLRTLEAAHHMAEAMYSEKKLALSGNREFITVFPRHETTQEGDRRVGVTRIYQDLKEVFRSWK